MTLSGKNFVTGILRWFKPRLYSETDETKASAIWTLKQVLITSLKLLHPYMPFITEEIYCTLMENGRKGCLRGINYDFELASL